MTDDVRRLAAQRVRAIGATNVASVIDATLAAVTDATGLVLVGDVPPEDLRVRVERLRRDVMPGPFAVVGGWAHAIPPDRLADIRALLTAVALQDR